MEALEHKITLQSYTILRGGLEFYNLYQLLTVPPQPHLPLGAGITSHETDDVASISPGHITEVLPLATALTVAGDTCTSWKGDLALAPKSSTAAGLLS